EGGARGGRGRGRDAEVVRRGGANRDGAAGAGDGTGRERKGGERRIAGRLERHAAAEGVDAIVGRIERVVRRQHRLAVAAGEVDRAAVAGDYVVEKVERGHGRAEGRARRGRGRGRDAEVTRRGGADRDRATGAGEGTA